MISSNTELVHNSKFSTETIIYKAFPGYVFSSAPISLERKTNGFLHRLAGGSIAAHIMFYYWWH